MADHPTPSNNDVPTPEDRHTPAQDSQATESTVSGAEAKAESTGMANGETRDTQLRFLEMSALFSLDKNVHASLLGVTCRDALPDEHFSWLARQRA